MNRFVRMLTVIWEYLMPPNAREMDSESTIVGPSELVRVRLVLTKYIPRVKLLYSPGTYVDRACFDFYPTRLAMDLAPVVLAELSEGLVCSDWVLERLEWAFRDQILVDAVWIIRNATGEAPSDP